MSSPHHINIFIAYAREDQAICKSLRKQLRGLEKKKRIRVWDDGEIKAGEDWNEKILQHLAAADIFVLLVSSDFIASDYAQGVELKKALEKHRAGTAKVFPVIVRDCLWKEEDFASIQVLPIDVVPIPVKNKHWASIDTPLTQVANAINEAAKELQSNRKKIKDQEQKAALFNAQVTKALQFRQNQQWAQAKHHYQQALNLWQTGLLPTRTALQEALQYCQTEINWTTALQNAEQQHQAGNYKKALTYYKQALQFKHTPQVAAAKAQCLADQKAARKAALEEKIPDKESRQKLMKWGAIALFLLFCWKVIIPFLGEIGNQNDPQFPPMGTQDTTDYYALYMDSAQTSSNAELYADAIAHYDKALSEKPNDSLALAYKQAAIEAKEAQSIEETEAATDQAYQAKIKEADRLLLAKAYQEARKEYLAASKLKTDENYPNEQIKDIDDILNAQEKEAQDEIAEEKRRQRTAEYNQLITQASEAFDQKQYNTAIQKYQAAQQLNPSKKSYLQGKINDINNILNPPPKPKPEPVVEQKKPATKTPTGMVLVKGGTFQMGCTSEQSNCDDDEKEHTVTLDNFYIDQTEVTNEQFCAFLNAKGNQKEGGTTWLEIESQYCLIEQVNERYQPKSGFANHPVIEVSWYGATAYAKWKGKRLPTEAEWEYAARGGQDSKGYKYAGSNDLASVAWYSENSGSKTHPVRTKIPNELGIYDMSGNVWEWCSDWYGTYSSEPSKNPRGASSGSRRVLRGGSWPSAMTTAVLLFVSGTIHSAVAITSVFVAPKLPKPLRFDTFTLCSFVLFAFNVERSETKNFF